MNHQSDHEIVYEIRCVLIICRILFECTYSQIKEKLEMKQRTAQAFIQRAVNKAKCTDIFEILICIRFMNRSDASQRVKNDFKISADMRKAILRYSDMKSHETMIDQENISISDMSADKRLIRSIIERVAHIHEHVQDERKIDEISRMMQSNKFLLTHVNENKRLTICL